MNGAATASAIMVARGEPRERLRRAIGALAGQEQADITELVIALPPLELAEYESDPMTGVSFPVRLVPNPGGQRSSGLNRAARAATGELLVRVDSRSLLPPLYVARCAALLINDAGIGAVGGVQAPIAGADTVMARGIGRALSNPWALGGAGYRRGITGPADTVYLGVYRRDQLLALGGWDERLLANEDYDVCQRYRQGGAIVWVDGDLAVQYLARATFSELFGQYHAFGRSKAQYWRRLGRRPARRQLLALGIAGAGAAVGFAVTARRPSLLLGAAPLAAAGLATLDHFGVRKPTGPAQRCAASVAYGTIWGAWVMGIAVGMLPSRRR